MKASSARRATLAGLLATLVIASSSAVAVSAADASEIPNPDDIQNPVLQLRDRDGGNVLPGVGDTGAPQNEGRSRLLFEPVGTVLAASKTYPITVNGEGGSARISFSTGVNVNASATSAVLSGESQMYWNGRPVPESIGLSDVVSAQGLNISASVGPGGASSTVNVVGTKIKCFTAAQNSTSITHVFRDWRLQGLLTYISEEAAGQMTWGSTTWVVNTW